MLNNNELNIQHHRANFQSNQSIFLEDSAILRCVQPRSELVGRSVNIQAQGNKKTGYFNEAGEIIVRFGHAENRIHASHHSSGQVGG